MKRFRFRLARVERLRGHAERVAQRVLGKHTTELVRLDAKLEQVDRGLVDCHDTESHALGAALLAGLTSLRARLTARRTRVVEEVELARLVYIERRRDRETIRKLREQRHAAWQREVTRVDQAELDELARLRFAREDVR